MATNWIALQESLKNIGNAYAQKKEKEQEMQKALQMMIMEAQIKNRIQQQNPEYQFNQVKMAQALDAIRRQSQFQRMGDVGFGGASPTAQEALPFVPQQFQQRFMQRPTSPPGFVGQQIRKPFEQAGQTLLPSEKGWERSRLPQRKPIKEPSYTDNFRNDFREGIRVLNAITSLNINNKEKVRRKKEIKKRLIEEYPDQKPAIDDFFK